MNLLSTLPFFANRSIPKQVVSESWKDRDAILSANVNLFCWKRPVNPEINAFLQGLLSGPALKIQQSISLPSLEQDLRLFLRNLGSYHGDDGPLIEDIRKLALDFLAFSKEGRGTLHLRLVDHNACTKFHLDGYHLRLFTTYCGIGTEWLPEHAVDRSGLGKSNHDIVKNPDEIVQMEAFEVGILKGEIPNKANKTKGIVHRSPAIADTGIKRIILRIDI